MGDPFSGSIHCDIEGSLEVVLAIGLRRLD